MIMMPSRPFARASTAILLLALTLSSCDAFATGPKRQLSTPPSSTPTAMFSHDDEEQSPNSVVPSRRSFFAAFAASAAATTAAVVAPPAATAAPADCFKDCLQNCNLIAPKDPQYCKDSCVNYCSQSD